MTKAEGPAGKGTSAGGSGGRSAPKRGGAAAGPVKDPATLEASWAERVRANREQAERFREMQAGDFYAPVSSLFVADPRRTGEPALEVLAEQAGSNETWLDIGAGAGRYALPLALRVREVIAVEPSAGMRRALRTGMDEHGIGNVRIVPGAWPDAASELGELPAADVALIAHVGYDIEAIGPFLDAMESAAARLCVATLFQQRPTYFFDQLWPDIHGEPRAALPALPEFLALLLARGRPFEVRLAERSGAAYESVEQAAHFARRQTWVRPGSEKDRLMQAAVTRNLSERNGRYAFNWEPGQVGIVSWAPPD
jgi:SAM-dependent methyltransferase